MEYLQAITMLLVMDYHVFIGQNLGLYKYLVYIGFILRKSTDEYKTIEFQRNAIQGMKIILDIYHV